MAYAEGDVISGYTIVRELGSGGMGAVYLARHPRLPRLVALKVLNVALLQDNSFRIRFEREADLAAKLFHRNIVTVLDRGAFEEQLWIAMQYVEGIDVSQLLNREGAAGLPLNQVVHIVGEVADALEFAHQNRLLHRDVKPANIMLAPSMHPDDPDLVMLADFGLAQIEGGSHSLTGTGNLVATLAYASPEQIEAKPFDHRVDIYALGCVLYELLTGEKPFPAENLYQVMQMHLKAPPPLPSARRRDLPPAFDAIVLTALAKNADMRYESARVMGNAIRAAAATAAATATAPPAPGAPHQVDPDRTAEQPRLSELTARLPPILISQRSDPMTAANRSDRLASADRRSRTRLLWAVGISVTLLAGLGLLVLRPFGGSESGDLRPTATQTSSSSLRPQQPTAGQMTTSGSSHPPATEIATNSGIRPSGVAELPNDFDPQGFSGDYQYLATVVEASGGGAQEQIIGSTETAIWAAQTSCAPSSCVSQIRTSEGGGYLGFTVADNVWTQNEDRKLSCKLIGSELASDSSIVQVAEQLIRNMTVSEWDAGVVLAMTGRTVRTQIEPCPNQFGALLSITYDISLTKIS